MARILWLLCTTTNIFTKILTGCCANAPILNAAIAYGATVAAANHNASILQIDLLFHVNELILEIMAVCSDHVEAAIISPPLRMGEILHYEKDFVLQQVCEYIHVM